MSKAFISGCSGHSLTADEKAFFRDSRPWGLILFGRNIEDRDQIRALVQDFQECVGTQNVPVLIDQEGGRVQRMRAPHWRRYPPGQVIGAIDAQDRNKGERAAWLHARLMAHDLLEVGINVNCAPVLDVVTDDADPVVMGDRSYSQVPETVARLGRHACEGFLAGGVAPVIKHLPGHGRATLDSHFSLPTVDEPREVLEKTDFVPFKLLGNQSMAMTAHIVFSQIDPDAPATHSRKIVQEVIRGHFGFDGLLMSDDISMRALSGSFEERSNKTIEAGCDMILHCNGNMEEMLAVANVVPELDGRALERAESAMEVVGNIEKADISGLHEEFDTLLATVDWPKVA